MTCGIYSIKNKINNKLYIGSSSNIELRWTKHLSDLRRNIHANPHLQSAWIEYGEENFKFEILLECSQEQLLLQEEIVSLKLGVYDREKGYNIAIKPGSPMKNRKHTAESLQKMSLKKAGNKNSFYGKKHSQETNKRISDAKKGKSLNADHKLVVLQTAFKTGENNINCKLTEQQVTEIRQAFTLFDSSKISFHSFCKQMAKIYCVNKSTIDRILRNKTRSKND
jgi:group I intron endonuclease